MRRQQGKFTDLACKESSRTNQGKAIVPFSCIQGARRRETLWSDRQSRVKHVSCIPERCHLTNIRAEAATPEARSSSKEKKRKRKKMRREEEEGEGKKIEKRSDPCDQEVDSDNDPDVDDVPDVIYDEDVNDNGNINAPSVGNQMRSIVIHNNPRPHMSLIDPDAVHIAEFPENPEILPTHRLAVNSDPEELFVGQRYESKEECVFAIKRYSMNISVDYKVAVSKPTLYIRECWKSAEGCNWRMCEIRKFFGPYTNTSTRMTEDHRKLDSKTICTCIMPMVKDMPTIKDLVLIAEMQARFQYRVSYRKAWITKQIAMEQLYRDFDTLYNYL
ncbi:hypothetical protein PVK06_040283 [Gossypium arboreum]|uniref:Transposase MuDR plant domain-containing protein n=1 Tax=Gossypium arboreum TaxID=29729 RepID=A0ABR0N525_GOSAR|nr:hypothetical protein PVK06_040283 [Gossypium arboreum]